MCEDWKKRLIDKANDNKTKEKKLRKLVETTHNRDALIKAF